MKQKITPFKKAKKPNIPLRRKIAILYTRLIFLLKILIFFLLYLLFFTKYFDHFKNEIAQNIYEITADMGLKLENVLIEGQINLPSEEILSSLNADVGTPILAINIRQVKNLLDKNHWVKTSAVERRLPNTIYIALLERIPIAIWQINKKIYLIDEEGFKITAQNVEKFSHLPYVVGIDANIYASKLIEDLSICKELFAKVTSAVRYGERRWNLSLEQNITVKMPENGFSKAYEYLINLYQANKLFDQNYKTIDLRDPAKYYIEKF